MSEPKKQEKDYTKEVDEVLPEAKSLAEVCVCGADETYLNGGRPAVKLTFFSKSGKLQDAVDKLFALEKQTRNVRIAPLI